jgi:hypothetical protein
MKLLDFDDKTDQLLKFMIALFLVSCVLFFSVIGSNIYSSYIIAENFEFDVFEGFVYILNLISYQNFLVIYILNILVANMQVNSVAEFLGKSLKSDNENLMIKRSDLRIVSDIIDRICDCVDTFKFSFTLNTLTFALIVFFYFVLGVYASLSYIVRVDPDRNELFFLILVTLWELYYLAYFFIIVWAADFMKNESVIVESMVIRILEKSSRCGGKLFGRCESLLLQLQHRRPLVSTGFFIVDWSLLFTILSGTVAYLAIIFQFELKTFEN